MAAAGVLCAAGSFFAAGLVVAASCAFDALDGALARATGAASVSMERSSTRSWTATPRLRSTGDWLCITRGRPGASRPRLPRQSDRCWSVTPGSGPGSSPARSGLRSSSSGWSPGSFSRRSSSSRSRRRRLLCVRGATVTPVSFLFMYLAAPLRPGGYPLTASSVTVISLFPIR
ncbi:MAG TPA: CDP-alcohol phosphatidyltransferase family protein [Methanoculleus thermophilus]|nr:CDP-alcohol phosphatidyltransferase family protein [Methanoculleus thermophilus]